MSETMKVNLTKIGIIVAIAFSLSSVVGAGWIAYDNAKEAKSESHRALMGLQKLELKQAKFEGVIDERTRNTQEDVKRIYDIVKEWSPNG